MTCNTESSLDVDNEFLSAVLLTSEGAWLLLIFYALQNEPSGAIQKRDSSCN